MSALSRWAWATTSGVIVGWAGKKILRRPLTRAAAILPRIVNHIVALRRFDLDGAELGLEHQVGVLEQRLDDA